MYWLYFCHPLENWWLFQMVRYIWKRKSSDYISIIIYLWKIINHKFHLINHILKNGFWKTTKQKLQWSLVLKNGKHPRSSSVKSIWDFSSVLGNIYIDYRRYQYQWSIYFSDVIFDNLWSSWTIWNFYDTWYFYLEFVQKQSSRGVL